MTQQEERILLYARDWIPRSQVTLRFSHGASSVIKSLLLRGLLESKWADPGDGKRTAPPALLLRRVVTRG